MKSYLCVLVLAPLASCGSITAVQLNPGTLDEKAGGSEGIVYYLPRPYLLVARGPDIETPGQKKSDQKSDVDKSTNQNPGANKSKTKIDKAIALAPQQHPTTIAKDPPSAASAPASSASDPNGKFFPYADNVNPDPSGQRQVAPTKSTTNPQTNAQGVASDATTFIVGANQYLLKLVYLPDCAHPMSLKITPGILGSTNIQPQMVNGWQLVGFSAQIDNSQLLTTVINALSGHAAPSSQPGTSTKKDSNYDDQVGSAANPQAVFEPGLYDLGCEGANRAFRLVRQGSDESEPDKK